MSEPQKLLPAPTPAPTPTPAPIQQYTVETKLLTKGSPLWEICSMLQFRRPGKSKTEEAFIERFLQPLELEKDKYGNLYKRIGVAPILWSSHTDTVHHLGGKQTLAATADGSTLKLSFYEKASNCLGGDCTAGVWVMMQMIRAKKPGLYVFHRDEESGGQGSRHIVKNARDMLDGIDHAIAFDRRGKHSIITHQGFQRCCSDDLAKVIAAHLGGAYRCDDTGSFTDTANYTDIVPECTNISVGYDSEHSKSESLNTKHLFAVAESMINLDLSTLPVKRDPKSVEWCNDDWSGYFGEDGWSGGSGKKSNYYFYPKKGGSATWVPAKKSAFVPASNGCYRKRTIAELVEGFPEEVADMLETWGLNAYDLEQAIYERGGDVGEEEDEQNDEAVDENE